VTTYAYDSLDRATFVGYGAQPGPSYESTVSYVYDVEDRLTQTVDSGTITRGFDGFDRMTSEITSQGTISYTYDAAGRRQTTVVTGQPTLNYTFDAGNNLTQMTQGLSTVQFTYDSAGRRTALTLPNGMVTTYGYDGASQLLSMTYLLGSMPLGNLTYGFDLVRQRVSVGGNFARVGIPNAVSATSYNANNQLGSWRTPNLFYDANGNMTSDGLHSYSWDARNHLIKIDAGSTASFSYDAFGRRTNKTILGTNTAFLYDEDDPVQELSGTTPIANLMTGDVDEYFQRTDSAGARNFLADALGSTIALADSSGALQSTYSFDPFGNTTINGSSTTNSYAYTGRELDSPLGLYFYRARYYNPAFGRFISEDPLRFGED